MASPQAPEIYQKPLADFPGSGVSRDAHAQEVITTISLGYAVKGWTAAVTVVDGMVRVIAIPEAGIAPKEYLLGLLHSGSIGKSPYAIDVVSMSLETRHGMWVARMPIKPKGYSKKKRTFGQPEFRFYTEAKGRFTDLLPTSDGSPHTLQ